MTPAVITAVSLYVNFYSHAREGRDNLVLAAQKPLIYISTHTPARGVTHAAHVRRILVKISTHTPARGVTGR